jgi:hypothetical protein
LRLIANKKLWVALHTHNNPVSEPKINRFKKELTYGKSALNLRSSYVYSFNGAERDDEVKGSGNSLDFGARIYDSRLGR